MGPAHPHANLVAVYSAFQKYQNGTRQQVQEKNNETTATTTTTTTITTTTTTTAATIIGLLYVVGAVVQITGLMTVL